MYDKYVLYNIKNKNLELIDDEDVDNIINKLYFLECRFINDDDIKNYKFKDEIHNVINQKNYIIEMKKNMSKIEENIPLYDVYSDNILIINKYNVYTRVVNNFFRFPDKEIISFLDVRERNIKNKIDGNKKIDFLEERFLNKVKLIRTFLSYYDLNILHDTYVKVFYKYSVGNKITPCKKPSFLPQFFHIKPYYTNDEIICISQNMNIEIKNKDTLKQEEINKLCHIVMKNEMNYENLLKHKIHILNNKSLGILQFYTLQGSSMMNRYLRGNIGYKQENIFLESLIKPVWNLILTSPDFDKEYTLYRFIGNDDFLNNIKIGDVYTENGFMSTTRDPFYKPETYNFGFILIKINIPKNTRGIALCVETVSHFPEEQEIIFPPKSKFKLINKDTDCIYYHIDKSFNSKIKTRYEFDWMGNEEISFNLNKTINLENTHVDFLKIDKKNNLKLIEKIKSFENYYVNKIGQFNVKLNNKDVVVIAEWYDSLTAYEKFYALKTENGFSLYTIYDNYLLFFIEIGENKNSEPEMHVNYYVKYNAIDPNKIVGDDKLILFYSSIAYYFDIHNIFIYASYMNCDNRDENNMFNGSYCLDFYQYFTTNTKKYSEDNILNTELYPLFSYFDLDMLKKISPNRIILKNDVENIELYQIYNKIYLNSKYNDNIIDFYIWLKNSRCYLLDTFINLIDKILGDNNPFKKDIYMLDPISYLYNRNYIQTYSSKFKMMRNIKRNILNTNRKNK